MPTEAADATHEYSQASRVVSPWSPDSKWIAYFSANAHGGNIYLMKPDGSAKTAVTRSVRPGSRITCAADTAARSAAP